MLAKEIEDCNNCPLLGSHCKGGMTSSPGGEPIEPPCVNWEPDTDLDEFIDEIESNELEEEEYIEQLYLAEEEQKQKQEIKRQRAKESRQYTRPETQKIKKLYKRVESNNSLQRLTNAFSMTNNMMNIKDKKPEQIKSTLEIENDKLRDEIKKLEKIKKIKLKELRNLRKEVEDENI